MHSPRGCQPQLVFSSLVRPYTPFCGLCGNDVIVARDGVRVHLAEDGSGTLGPEMDLHHRPRPEDYHNED